MDGTLDVQRTISYLEARDPDVSLQETERLWRRERVREFDNIAIVALRRLTALDGAQAVADLLIPPGNRLQALQGDRQGQHSIRVNDQYLICFIWNDENAYEVEITKHHQ